MFNNKIYEEKIKQMHETINLIRRQISVLKNFFYYYDNKNLHKFLSEVDIEDIDKSTNSANFLIEQRFLHYHKNLRSMYDLKPKKFKPYLNDLLAFDNFLTNLVDELDYFGKTIHESPFYSIFEELKTLKKKVINFKYDVNERAMEIIPIIKETPHQV